MASFTTNVFNLIQWYDTRCCVIHSYWLICRVGIFRRDRFGLYRKKYSIWKRKFTIYPTSNRRFEFSDYPHTFLFYQKYIFHSSDVSRCNSQYYKFCLSIYSPADSASYLHYYYTPMTWRRYLCKTVAKPSFWKNISTPSGAGGEGAGDDVRSLK